MNRYISLSAAFLFGTLSFVFAESDISIRENSFQSDCPIIRAERPFKLEAFIDFDGAIDYTTRLTVPESCTVSEATKTPSKEGVTETWDIVCRRPVHTCSKRPFF